MRGEYAIDTNIVGAWYRGELDLATRLGPSSTASLPVIVVGELLYGLQGLTGPRHARLEAFIRDISATLSILNVNAQTAAAFASIKHRLKLSGRPIPENDLWIAAIAMQNDMTLVSRDVHFAEIEGLALERW